MTTFALKKFVFAVAAITIAGCEPVSTSSLVDQRKQRDLEKGAQVVAACREVSCAELNLSFASLEDYTILNDMDHVTALELRYNSFENLEDIGDMQQLTDLRIVATGIREVSSFADFKNLSVLDIQSALAQDIRPTLLRMPALKDIAINLPDDGDISFVRRLPNLQNMSLLGRQISDLGPLKKHPSLEKLSLRLDLPTDLSPLLEIPNLRTIRVFDRIERDDRSDVIDKLRASGVVVELIRSVVI